MVSSTFKQPLAETLLNVVAPAEEAVEAVVGSDVDLQKLALGYFDKFAPVGEEKIAEELAKATEKYQPELKEKIAKLISKLPFKVSNSKISKVLDKIFSYGTKLPEQVSVLARKGVSKVGLRMDKLADLLRANAARRASGAARE